MLRLVLGVESDINARVPWQRAIGLQRTAAAAAPLYFMLAVVTVVIVFAFETLMGVC